MRDWRTSYPDPRVAETDMARLRREVAAVPKPFSKQGRKTINKIHANLKTPLDNPTR